MDLAQIRKKARQSKVEVEVPVVAVVSPVPEPEPESAASLRTDPVCAPAPVPGVELGFEPTTVPVLEPVPEEVLEEPAPEERLAWEYPSPEDLPVSVSRRGFDPVALIMAGRAASGEKDNSLYAEQEEENTGIREFLCFRISREEYALDIMDIKEIIKPRDVTEVPRSPQFISGIISLRGMILPVFDIALRLGFVKTVCTGKERVVVVRRGEEYIGILVDEVSQVVRIGGDALEPPPPVLDGIDREFVTGIGRHGERMLILLNMEKVLDINVR
jgi:purine-binding chemotaxis protein CheW